MKIAKLISFFISIVLTNISSQASNNTNELEISYLGDNNYIANIHTNKRYLLLPVEDSSHETRMSLICDNTEVHSFDIRLASNKTDYFVPLDLADLQGRTLRLRFKSELNSAGCREMHLSDYFDTTNYEYHRPIYHFTPPYGWMNDPNGMVYKDGEYHLFYQYNPYGSRWGNMNWGHAISRDLTTWQHHPVAITPDALGTIFSGSAVVDHNNTAGFGYGAIVAIYTQNSDRQMQSIAYSNDNGRSFTKYSNNPVLISDDRDFRDPKVFWHQQTNKWIMILAVGERMHIYSSPNLKNWIFESSFGEGQGAHGHVWECPDLFPLPVEGCNEIKWVMLCNSGGGPFGGAATQYFVGDFDGHTFTNDSPDKIKWMDQGKDHYATVTWSDAPNNRRIAIAWMSNWQYSNDVPTLQYRSADTLPRDLSLYYGEDGDIYIKSTPVTELQALRDNDGHTIKSLRVNGEYTIDQAITENDGSMELSMDIRYTAGKILGIKLQNAKGEEVDLRVDMKQNRIYANRKNSGIVSFSKDFPTTTWAQIRDKKDLKLQLYIDRSSLEIFYNHGEQAMTNILFPTVPYDRITLYTEGGSVQVKNFTSHKLKTN